MQEKKKNLKQIKQNIIKEENNKNRKNKRRVGNNAKEVIQSMLQPVICLFHKNFKSQRTEYRPIMKTESEKPPFMQKLGKVSSL